MGTPEGMLTIGTSFSEHWKLRGFVAQQSLSGCNLSSSVTLPYETHTCRPCVLSLVRYRLILIPNSIALSRTFTSMLVEKESTARLTTEVCTFFRTLLLELLYRLILTSSSLLMRYT